MKLQDAFLKDGAAHHVGVFTGPEVEAWRTALAGLPQDQAGLRLTLADAPKLEELRDGALAQIAARHIGPDAFPVRAVLFDKTANRNWALGWHQDRTIVVTTRVATPGYGPWSRKQGLVQVMPPIGLLERMATLRLHLDDCDEDNSPLLAANGSHRLGLVPAAEAEARAAALPRLVCTARSGDVWAYSTPILHASDRAARPRRRRVLQVDYAIERLPGELTWAGLDAHRNR